MQQDQVEPDDCDNFTTENLQNKNASEMDPESRVRSNCYNRISVVILRNSFCAAGAVDESRICQRAREGGEEGEDKGGEEGARCGGVALSATAAATQPVFAAAAAYICPSRLCI